MRRQFDRNDNAWLATDRRERLKSIATVVILAGAALTGVIVLVVSLV
jgi:hypothetical protein